MKPALDSSSGRVGHGVAPALQHLSGVLEPVGHVHAEHLGAELVQAQLERGDDPEVATASAQRPVKVLVLLGAGAYAPAVGKHHLGRHEVVDGHPVPAPLMGDAAAERQPGDSGLRHDAAGRGQPERRGHCVDLGPGGAALHVHAAPRRIHIHGTHGREVDHQAAVGRRGAGHVVATAAHGQLETALARETHGGRHVGGVRAARDQGGPLVDHSVPDLPGLVVGRMVGRYDLAGETLGECGGQVVVSRAQGRHV